MMQFKDVYPIWKWNMLSWVIPCLICFVLWILISFVYIPEETSAKIIGQVCLISMSALCLSALTVQLKIRVGIKNKLILFMPYKFYYNKGTAPVAFLCDEGVDRDAVWEFLPGGVWGDLNKIEEIYGYGEVFGSIEFNREAYKPVTFVCFKRPGEVDRVIGTFVQKCAGIQIGNWCEVEWLPGKHKMNRLIMHELTHVVIEKTFPRWNEAKHHELIRKILK